MARVSGEEAVSVLGIEDLGSALIRSSVDALVIVDDEGLISEFNPAAESILGYRREDAVGREMPGLLLAPEVRERVRIALRRGTAGGEAPLFDRPVEVPALRADGSRLRVELSIARLAAFDPPLFGVYLRDLSRRRAVDFTHLHLAAIVESTDDAVLSKDSRGIVTSWNPGAERLYGYSAEEAIGRHVSFLVPSDHRGEEARILARAMTGERIETYETERIRADGTRIEVSLTVSPIAARDEGVIGASVIARDITAHKRAEEMQLRLARQAVLRAEVALALAEKESSFRRILQRCAAALVRHLDADFAHIWILDTERNTEKSQQDPGGRDRKQGNDRDAREVLADAATEPSRDHVLERIRLGGGPRREHHLSISVQDPSKSASAAVARQAFEWSDVG